MRLVHPEHGEVHADHSAEVNRLKAYGYKPEEAPQPKPEPKRKAKTVEPEHVEDTPPF